MPKNSTERRGRARNAPRTDDISSKVLRTSLAGVTAGDTHTHTYGRLSKRGKGMAQGREGEETSSVPSAGLLAITRVSPRIFDHSASRMVHNRRRNNNRNERRTGSPGARAVLLQPFSLPEVSKCSPDAPSFLLHFGTSRGNRPN